jgi:hypothetical protein
MFFHCTKQDMPLITRPALTFLALVSACIGLYGGALLFHNAQQRTLEKIRAEMDRVEFLHLKVAEEGQTIRNYLDRYRQLALDGIISGEDRLDLLENIAGIREIYRLYPVRVEIEPQMSWSGTRAQETGDGPTLRARPVRLSLPLLHEGDLVRLLDGLSAVPGLFVTDTCVIERSSSAVAPGRPGLGENLNASCRLFWITLQD